MKVFFSTFIYLENMSSISVACSKKTSSVISVEEVSYSELMSVSQFIKYVIENQKDNDFEDKINELLVEYVKENDKYKSLTWNQEDELKFDNEESQERWNALHSNNFETYSEANKQKENRSKYSILHYVIPISFPVSYYHQKNKSSSDIRVKAYGLMIYAGRHGKVFSIDKFKYLRLKSLENSKFSRFDRYLSLNTFSVKDYSINFSEDFNNMNAFAIEGPFIKIHSNITNQDGTENEVKYYGDYTYNIHLTKLNKETKIKKIKTEIKNKIVFKDEKYFEYHGNKKDTKSIYKFKYDLIFAWMSIIKDYSKLSRDVHFVLTNEETHEEECEENLEINVV